MKRIYALTVILLAASSLAIAQNAKLPANPSEQAVLKLEQAWVDALIKADVAALERLYDDKLVYTHSSGSVDDKANYIANIKSGAVKYQSIDRDEIKVNVYGDAAIVACRALMKIVAGGENRTINTRMLHVYAKQKGRWQMVAHQTTRIP